MQCRTSIGRWLAPLWLLGIGGCSMLDLSLDPSYDTDAAAPGDLGIVDSGPDGTGGADGSLADGQADFSDGDASEDREDAGEASADDGLAWEGSAALAPDGNGVLPPPGDASGGDGGAALDGGAGLDGADEGPTDGAVFDAADAGVAAGLVAYYLFDETSGTSAHDSSGNGHTATLMGGATFANGLSNNAVTLSGRSPYVSLPGTILGGTTSFSVATWVNLSSAPTWSRIFDFGSGPNSYMFLTPSSDVGTLRFAVTTSGTTGEQQINAAGLSTGSWQHVAVTLSGNVGTLYVNGAVVAQNPNMTLNPASLAVTTQDWIARSQFSVDPYMRGQMDNFRVYSRALSGLEVQRLFRSLQ